MYEPRKSQYHRLYHDDLVSDFFVTNIIGPLIPIIIKWYKIITHCWITPSFLLAYGIISIPADLC